MAAEERWVRVVPIANIRLELHRRRMSYRKQSKTNWGVAIACSIALPLALVWSAITVLGGSLVRADPAANCSGVVWPFVQGIFAIAATAAALGYVINLLLRAIHANSLGR